MLPFRWGNLFKNGRNSWKYQFIRKLGNKFVVKGWGSALFLFNKTVTLYFSFFRRIVTIDRIIYRKHFKDWILCGLILSVAWYCFVYGLITQKHLVCGKRHAHLRRNRGRSCIHCGKRLEFRQFVHSWPKRTDWIRERLKK